MGLAKAIVLALFNSIAFVLFMISCGTAWTESTRGTTKTEYTYWEVCTKVGDADATCRMLKKETDGSCEKRWELIEAGRAFTLISTIFVGVLTIISFYRIFNTVILAKQFIIGKVYMVVGLLALIFGVLNWIVGFAQYSEEYCSFSFDSNTDANKIGPSAPAAFVASCVWLVSLILECVLSDIDLDAVTGGDDSNSNSGEEKKEEEKKEEESKAEPTAEEEKKEEASAEPAAEEEKKADE